MNNRFNLFFFLHNSKFVTYYLSFVNLGERKEFLTSERMNLSFEGAIVVCSIDQIILLLLLLLSSIERKSFAFYLLL